MKKVTILILRNNVQSGIKRLLLPNVLIAFFVLLFSLLSLFSLKVSYDLFHYASNRIVHTMEVFKNDQFEGELTFIKKLSEDLKKDITDVFYFDDKVRMLYGLEAVSKDIRDVGVGGPDFSTAEKSVITIFNDKKNSEISAMKMQLEKLIRQAEFEKGSIRETYANVVETNKRLRRFPSVLPVFGRITSGFGPRMHPIKGRMVYHQGIDIANKKWTPIYASADGIVHYLDYSKGFGNLIILRHGFGFDTFYGHLQAFAIERGQFVMRGDLIGYLGATGQTTGPHLHYEIRRFGKAIDPMEFIYPVSTVMNN